MISCHLQQVCLLRFLDKIINFNFRFIFINDLVWIIKSQILGHDLPLCLALALKVNIIPNVWVENIKLSWHVWENQS